MGINPNQQTIQVKSTDKLGRAQVENVELTNNDITPLQDVRYVTLTRLSLPARFEAVVSDVVLWVGASGLVGSLFVGLFALGYVLLATTLFCVLAFPVLLWALWLKAHVGTGWQNITSVRVTLVLAGLILIAASLTVHQNTRAVEPVTKSAHVG